MKDNEKFLTDLLDGSIASGNLGMVLEHAADLKLSKDATLQLLSRALNIRAKQWEDAAEKVGPAKTIRSDWHGIVSMGGNGHELDRARNLRLMSRKLLDP